MTRLTFAVLLLFPAAVFGQTSHDDSLRAHYPLHVGNGWDYGGGNYFLGSQAYFYPILTLRTAIGDSLHSNGKHYTIIEETVYYILGQLHPGALGAIYRNTYLQRVDSLTLNVWQNYPDTNSLPGGELLIDSLRAQVGDTIFTNINRDYNSIYQLFEQENTFLFGRTRLLRKLYVVNPIVSHTFFTGEGLGEIFWEYAEGDATFGELRGAVIQGDTLGLLVRAQSSKLEATAKQLYFSFTQPARTLYFRNPSLGLTIVDSVALAHDDFFTLQPSYDSARFGGGWFQKGPFLVFPNDSIRVDLAIIPEDIPRQAFIDTFRIYAHGLNRETLPEIKIPVTFSPIVTVEQKDEPASAPRQIALKIYPNPSNAMATISFEMKERNHATIRVIDLLGREVAVLLNEAKAPGPHRITWDAQGMNAGIYFIELKAAGERRVQKWLLLK